VAVPVVALGGCSDNLAANLEGLASPRRSEARYLEQERSKLRPGVYGAPRVASKRAWRFTRCRHGGISPRECLAEVRDETWSRVDVLRPAHAHLLLECVERRAEWPLGGQR
jgi:hypothetical protein